MEKACLSNICLEIYYFQGTPNLWQIVKFRNRSKNSLWKIIFGIMFAKIFKAIYLAQSIVKPS